MGDVMDLSRHFFDFRYIFLEKYTLLIVATGSARPRPVSDRKIVVSHTGKCIFSKFFIENRKSDATDP